MSIKPPSTIDYLTAAPTVLSTIARYALHGSPHPHLSLQDLIAASLFNHLSGADISADPDQSVYENRLKYDFAASVTVRVESCEPLLEEESKYYTGELSHPDVRPARVPAFFLTPKKQLSSERKIVLYFHGGGYGRGDPTGGGFSNAMANRLGRIVCSIDYRLGNTEPFPAAVQDCITAYFHLRFKGGYAASEIILAGESAGAGLVLATLLHLRELGEVPDRAILVSPFMQTLDQTKPSYSLFEGVDFISASGLPDVTKGYMALKPRSRYIQLFDNSFAGLPPLFVSYGDAEIFCDDDREFCERARKDGLDVIEDVGVGKVHVWIALPHYLQEARLVWSRMKSWIDGPRARI